MKDYMVQQTYFPTHNSTSYLITQRKLIFQIRSLFYSVIQTWSEVVNIIQNIYSLQQ